MADAADGSSTFLEIGPALVVSLGLVEINGIGVLVDLVKPELVGCALVLEDIWESAGRIFGNIIESRHNVRILSMGQSAGSNDHFHHPRQRYSPNRMHPGSLRDWIALFSIILRNSSMRSSLISASTMTENGFDILRAVLEEKDLDARQDALLEASDEALVLKAEEDRSKRRQEEVTNFMASV